MWTCSKCGAEVEQAFDCCSSCGAEQERVADVAPLSTAAGEHQQASSVSEPPTILDAALDTHLQLDTAAPTPLAEAQVPDTPSEEPVSYSLETRLALQSQLSTLMDQYDTPGWTVNPAHHPDVNAFIQQHASDGVFLRNALALQANRARYHDTMRRREEARARAAEGPPAPSAQPLFDLDEVLPSADPVPSPSVPERGRTSQWLPTFFMLLVCVVVALTGYLLFVNGR
jgi:hypothetical protein